MNTITETRNYNECMKYVENLEHFYVGAKLSQQKNDRIKNALQRFCRERTYQSMDSNAVNCSSDNNLGETTLNTIIKSPVVPSRENPFPLMVFSSRF
jgi:hypothetical protein